MCRMKMERGLKAAIETLCGGEKTAGIGMKDCAVQVLKNPILESASVKKKAACRDLSREEG